MNNERRQKLTEIAEKLAELYHEVDGLAQEERDAFDNLPESLQTSEREAAAEALEEAAQEIDSAQHHVEEATE